MLAESSDQPFADDLVVRRPGLTPAATVAKGKNWAAIKEFNMTPEKAGEHVLQISGTYDRPAPNTTSASWSSTPSARSPSTSSPTSASTARSISRAKSMSTPDERALQADLAKPSFRLGEAEKRWSLIELE